MTNGNQRRARPGAKLTMRLCCLALLPACQLSAPDLEEPEPAGPDHGRDGWYAYLGAVRATIDGDFDGKSEGPGTTPEFDPDVGVGLALGYTAGRFSLEGFLESTTFDDVDYEGFEVEEGELESLGLRAIVDIGPRDARRRWKPYVHVGVARSTLTLVDGPGDDVAFNDIELDGLAFELGLGVEARVTRRLAARLGWVRRWLDVEEDSDEPDADAGGDAVLLGLVLRF